MCIHYLLLIILWTGENIEYIHVTILIIIVNVIVA